MFIICRTTGWGTGHKTNGCQKYLKITRKGLKAYSTVSPNRKTRPVDIVYTQISNTELQMTSSVSQSRFLQRQLRDEVNVY